MRFAEAVGVLQNRTDDLALSPLSAQTSKVRGFGRHGVGGANPADPRGLSTLIGTWSALHHLQQNRHALPPRSSSEAPLHHYTNGSTAVENLSLPTACLFLSSTLIVNHFPV